VGIFTFAVLDSLGDILVDFLVSWGGGVLECGACLAHAGGRKMDPDDIG